jgi:hypothetical protein
MRLLEPVSADEVIARWLEAELSSPRFRIRLGNSLRILRLPRRFVERPVLTSRRENRLRRQLFRLYRGDLWDALSPRTAWWRAAITPQEFRRLRVINYPTWTLLSRHTGRLAAAAGVIDGIAVPAEATGRWAREARAVITHVRRIRDRMTWATMPIPLILLRHPTGGIWTILEGNKRATGLYIRSALMKAEPFPPGIPVLAGTTPEPCACLRLR